MKVRKMISEAEGEAKDIGRRLKNRDFSGNKGVVIKNSSYQLAKIIVSKGGSILFTIIIARILMPELFGLYGLAISTILFLNLFSDLGLNTAMITFISRNIDISKSKSKSYFIYLTKYKMVLLLISSLIIIFTTDFLANNYYQKPIFYAVLAGIIYLPLMNLQSFLENFFRAKNNFKVDFVGEIIFQVLRITIVPAILFYLLPSTFSTEIRLLGIFLGLSGCFLLTDIFYVVSFLRDKPFKNATYNPLSKIEKRDLRKFIFPLSITVLSGSFFGFIDTIMLGHYVSADYIGYYQAAFNLVMAASGFISFIAVATFPIFARLKGDKLKITFSKSRTATAMISTLVFFITFLIAPIIVDIVYGKLFNESIFFLKIFAILLLTVPLEGLYQAYYISQKRTKEFTILLIMTTILNVVLNFTFINWGLQFGMKEAVFGACIATILSRMLYLFGLAIYKKKIEEGWKLEV